MKAADAVRAAFRERFGREGKLAAAPGRVNLIGEHTDYNDGFVVPVAIDRYCVVAFDSNESGALRGFSIAENDERAQSVERLSPKSTSSWFDYAAGVVWVHRAAGLDVPGMDFVVGGDVPVGAGLSSSAAFELAVARAVVAIAGGSWDGALEARLAQKAENEYVGMPCGIMDPMAVSLSSPGSAMLLDCRELTFERIPIPAGVLVVVMDTGTRRALTDGAYEERRGSCHEAAATLSVRALRDTTVPELSSAGLSEISYRRASHVVRENERTQAFARALRDENLTLAGSLMAQSHESLRELFEVSSPALDRMVEIAWEHPAVVGARMTGAGFGGCAVALVEASGTEDFVKDVESRYREETRNPGTLFTCRAVGGARIV
jgi:galactokinase